eukprot:TRINITY_DN9928_c0_g1_i1.p1 TRINITY_DN9928_c0_g1~~TRINITY_DN9928_c0_g1_i1.p1  ORF type:complete len:475 (+),score=110.58 TRINITY_DN9928_c0_g1_i1:42-1466(+)
MRRDQYSVVRLDRDLSSTLREIVYTGRFLNTELRNIFSNIPSRHDNKAVRLDPVPPTHSKNHAFDRKERAWWHSRWPDARKQIPTHRHEPAPSIQSDEVSNFPELEKSRRACNVARVEGAVSPVQYILKPVLTFEESLEVKRKTELMTLLALVQADDATVNTKLSSKTREGRTRVIDTTHYYPIIPPDAAKVDVRFAACRFRNMLGWCPRGLRCTFVHSKSRLGENFRRMVLKVVARVQWVMTGTEPQWPPRELDPPPSTDHPKWVWNDVQSVYLPFWILTKPWDVDAVSYVSSLCDEIIDNGGRLKRLELRKCPLTPKLLERLCYALQSCKHLAEVVLAYTDLTDREAPVLGEFMDGNQTVTTLEVPFNNLGPAGVDILASSASSRLKHLSLHSNPVGDEGVAALSRMLQGRSKLQSLRISSCACGRSLLGLCRSLACVPFVGCHTPTTGGACTCFHIICADVHRTRQIATVS